MRASLRALLAGLIDYAGLFPPAKLPLPEALANYLRFREGPDAWMLGRFVCPASRLRELPDGVSLSCSALARGGDTAEAFLAGLDADLADVAASPVSVEVLEAKLPVGVTAEVAGLRSLLREAAAKVERAGLAVFFEVSASDGVGVSRLVTELRYLSLPRPAGFKLRAGGLEPSAFPTSQQVAQAVVVCLFAGVPFKATAGLHHPFPRFGPGVQARMHGFVNLFTAGVLIHALTVGADVVRAVLEDDDPAHFVFTDKGLRWRELEVSTEQIAAARQKAVLSFGSCSFDEPRDDLGALGWM
jgi:hypothetical protein